MNLQGFRSEVDTKGVKMRSLPSSSGCLALHEEAGVGRFLECPWRLVVWLPWPLAQPSSLVAHSPHPHPVTRPVSKKPQVDASTSERRS